MPMDVDALTAPVEPVEAYLRAFLESRPLPVNLREAVGYSLLGPGKRLRPILVVRSCQAVGGTLEQALAPAGAIELIHCFSLVHDDLPAMDDDDLRRGRPTLHVHAGEAMAILAGDLMNTLAFELIAERLAAPTAAAVSLELARATHDMIAGQVYDTLPAFPQGMAPLERLRTIHRHKTGALIRAACRMGGIVGGADEARLAALTDYAEAIGLMFQVVDDILDVTQTTEHLGKTAGKDVEQGKLTYPALIGLDASRREAQRLQDEAHAALDRLDVAGRQDGIEDAAGPLRRLCDYMAVRSK
jgi:geranylgeranyl pyrophosphate synthase